jgi:nucleoid-associated protein YgaU
MKVSYLLPIAAAPAFAGVAATIALSPQALASTTAAAGTTQHAATQSVAAQQAAPSPARLQSATRRETQHKPGSGQTQSYTVRSGDSLSAIAERFYHKQDAWPVLYWANHKQVQWANIIEPGQVLSIPAEPSQIPGAPSQLAPPAPAAPAAPAAASYTPAPASQSYTSAEAAPAQAAPAQAAPAAAAATYSGSSSYSGSYPGGSFGACVVARESGGNAQVMNSSGHYGLYQFSASTWAAYGGNPATFGNASVSEQNQVFSNALAAGGQSNWAPYDGC